MIYIPLDFSLPVYWGTLQKHNEVVKQMFQPPHHMLILTWESQASVEFRSLTPFLQYSGKVSTAHNINGFQTLCQHKPVSDF